VKILLYTELAVEPGWLFWHRDLGLLTKAFRTLGHEARLVVHPAKLRPSERAVRSETRSPHAARNPKSSTRKGPVIWASHDDVRNPAWWQSHKPDLVILGLWTRPKYDPIRRAVLSATSRVIERADSDGMRTASCGLSTYARRRYDYFRDQTSRWPAILSIPASVLYSFASILGTPWIEARLARTLMLLPALAVETPMAARLWKKLAVKLNANPNQIHFIPHPVQTDIFRPDSSVRKKKQIVSVGRWESYQKNLDLLLQTVLRFLGAFPTWSAQVVGSGLPTKSPHPRLIFSAHRSPRQLAKDFQRSRIFVSSSRYESFGLAASEAALCGCQVISLSCQAVRVPWHVSARAQHPYLRLVQATKSRKPTRRGGTSLHRILCSAHIARKFLRIALRLF